MVSITSFDRGFYYPPRLSGLEELIRLPGSEGKKSGIPNSTIWVFNGYNHGFEQKIHGRDLGCGMTAFKFINDVNPKEATDVFYAELKKTKILGRGNHFVDICSEIEPAYEDVLGGSYKIIFLHTHGSNNEAPLNLKSALEKQYSASEERTDLGYSLADLLGVKCQLIGDWPHNTVEETVGKVIYRKGAVKVTPEKIFFLPAHLGAKVLIYTVSSDHQLPYSSMPHATGRSGARGKTKVPLEKASELRELVYIPQGISDSSLRTEHPSCYNGFEKIFNSLRDKGFVSLGQTEILSYVGKI